MRTSIKICYSLFLLPLAVLGQQGDTTIRTIVSGQVLDASSRLPLPYITVELVGVKTMVKTDNAGRFMIKTPLSSSQIRFSSIGFRTIINMVEPGKTQVINVFLEKSDTKLQEVAIRAAKRPRYKNKDNPAVSLIQEVINHKEANRMLSVDYVQYHQYERIGFSLFDLSGSFLKSKAFSKYRFLLDTAMVINDSVKKALPVYMSEKYADVYSRKSPAKMINILKAHKEVNYSALIDTAALDYYLNRLYGIPDIYGNNIFVLTKQFLSPIADHAPEFYKFFITDTIKSGNERFIEVSFTPRNLGDLLFEGKLYITMDGKYGVKSDYLHLNNQINVNFVRRMDISQDFKRYPDGRFYLVKSEVQSDFSLKKEKGTKIFGDRTVFFSDYVLSQPKEEAFYQGSSTQIALSEGQKDPRFWNSHRADTLSASQAQVYTKIDSLQKMPSYKRTMWITKFITGGYGDIGPVQIGPNGSFYSFNSLEGNRISIGGRTMQDFNPDIYLEGYTAYGFKDKKQKYYLGGIYAFNDIPPWDYPSNYLKVSYLYDADVPGQYFMSDKFQSVLGSFTRNSSNLWQYNRIFKASYAKDFPSHLSYSVGIKYWNQRAADELVFQQSDDQTVSNLTTTELNFGIRYAPKEHIFKGTQFRHTIPSKYPIIALQANYGVKGVLGSENKYLDLSGSIRKRFYMSQLGYSDATLLGGTLLGRVPFPLLPIMPANQTYLYDENAYNNMNFLEFVGDHYVGLQVTHAFEGFILNKVPVLKHLKLREYLSFKILYGGLRNQNNPAYHPELYKFPTTAGGSQLTFPLGNRPYIEIGAGVGNIFKVIRVDVIKRLSYLDHSGASSLGLRFTIGPVL